MPSKTKVPPGLRHLPPALLSVVERQCDGDWRRCVLEKDGAITVLNRPRTDGPAFPAATQEKPPAKKKAVKRASVQPPVQAREDLTAVRDPRTMEQPEPLAKKAAAKKAVQPPKQFSEPQLPPRKTETSTPVERKALRTVPPRAPIAPAPRVSETVRDRLSQVEREATEQMREQAPRFDRPIPPEFDIRDSWEKLDAERVATSMLKACLRGLPESLPLDMHADVLALHGLDFDLVVSSVRNPHFVEIAAIETLEKKYPVLRFFRGDITTVVGLREAAYPKIIATYVWPQLLHDRHTPGTSKGASGGGGARKQGGLPNTPRAVIKRLRSLGAVIEDDELGDTPVSVVYQGQDLGKVPRKGDKNACETAYQRTIRKMEAIIRRAAAS